MNKVRQSLMSLGPIIQIKYQMICTAVEGRETKVGPQGLRWHLQDIYPQI